MFPLHFYCVSFNWSFWSGLLKCDGIEIEAFAKKNFSTKYIFSFISLWMNALMQSFISNSSLCLNESSWKLAKGNAFFLPKMVDDVLDVATTYPTPSLCFLLSPCLLKTTSTSKWVWRYYHTIILFDDRGTRQLSHLYLQTQVFSPKDEVPHTSFSYVSL